MASSRWARYTLCRLWFAMIDPLRLAAQTWAMKSFSSEMDNGFTAIFRKAARLIEKGENLFIFSYHPLHGKPGRVSARCCRDLLGQRGGVEYLAYRFGQPGGVVGGGVDGRIGSQYFVKGADVAGHNGRSTHHCLDGCEPHRFRPGRKYEDIGCRDQVDGVLVSDLSDHVNPVRNLKPNRFLF